MPQISDEIEGLNFWAEQTSSHTFTYSHSCFEFLLDPKAQMTSSPSGFQMFAHATPHVATLTEFDAIYDRFSCLSEYILT